MRFLKKYIVKKWITLNYFNKEKNTNCFLSHLKTEAEIFQQRI